ncbi:hypothetical protein H5410_054509 [Solanum commersonii]|uniref:Uncharacterized protein n=1 Tax=Solanum commersonii TaxID=4109 RepID=A0A9J5WG89_SOLCO|nr:hypothetical protein H5410_054509 [Solanum commersonii]
MMISYHKSKRKLGLQANPTLKVRFIKQWFKPIKLYETKCCSVKNLSTNENSKQEDVEMDAWDTTRNEITNESILDKVRVNFTMDKMRDAKLRRFKYVKRRCTNILVKRVIG